MFAHTAHIEFHSKQMVLIICLGIIIYRKTLKEKYSINVN